MVVSLGYVENKMKEFLKEEYNLELTVPVEINKRLKNVYGRVSIFQTPNGKIFVDKIEFHPGILTTNKYDTINNLIKHEAIHYALIKKGGEFRDNDVEFNLELEKHNVGSCDLELKHNMYIYKCKQCLSVTSFSLGKKTNLKCNNCGGELKAKKIYNKCKDIKDEVNTMEVLD